MSAGYSTSTYTYTPNAATSTKYTSTISSASGGSSGLIGIFYPYATGYVTKTTTYGPSSTTVTISPSGTVSGTILVEQPAQSQAACGNQGMLALLGMPTQCIDFVCRYAMGLLQQHAGRQRRNWIHWLRPNQIQVNDTDLQVRYPFSPLDRKSVV